MEYLIIGIITIIFISGLNIVCFFVGAKVGQKVINKEEIKISNPIKTIKEDIKQREEEKEAYKEQEKLDTIAYNIDTYDGTPIGQKDIPR